MFNNLFVTFEKEINRCYLNNIMCKKMYPNTSEGRYQPNPNTFYLLESAPILFLP